MSQLPQHIYGYNAKTGLTEAIPIYTNERDVSPFCDKPIKIAAPTTYLGWAYVPARDVSTPEAELANTHGVDVPWHTVNISRHNHSSWQAFNLHTAVIDVPGEYGYISANARVDCRFGSSYGNCGFCLTIDTWLGPRAACDNRYPRNQAYLCGAHEDWGYRAFYFYINNQYVSHGRHYVYFNYQLDSGHGDSSDITIYNYSFTARPISVYQVPSNIHVVTGGKEYALDKEIKTI